MKEDIGCIIVAIACVFIGIPAILYFGAIVAAGWHSAMTWDSLGMRMVGVFFEVVMPILIAIVIFWAIAKYIETQ